MHLLPRREHPTRYVMLISSLPFHGSLFTAKQTPLSRMNLDQRLDMLDERDSERLRRVERVIQWDAIETHLSDPEMVRRADEVLASLAGDGLETLCAAVRNRFELRTAVAALRWRHRGHGPPSAGTEPWGFGRWTRRIAANWNQRDFGLGSQFKWLNDAQACLDNDDPKGLEKLLLGRAWQDLGRLSQGHYFDFTAVVLYVLRWHIIDRWTRMDADEAIHRFDALLLDGLGNHGALFEGEGGHA